MDDTDGDAGRSTGRRNKVARLIDEYGLEGVGTELEERWTAPGDDRMSLRSLADYFNRRLLTEAMSETGTPLSGEVENLYSLLTDDDVSDADVTRTRRRLERDGVDVDQLLSDFISYQAIRSYLKDYRGVDYERNTRDQAVVEAENIQRLRGRTATVTQSKLDQLENSGDIVIGDHRTIVDVNVICEDCGQQFDVDELLERGGCACQETPDA